MERELVHLFEAAKKAADLAAAGSVSPNGPEVSRCVDALKQLKAFPVSYDILLSAQVGKSLRLLTKHPRPTIHAVASDLLELWQKIVLEERSKRKKNGTINSVKVEKIQKPSTVKAEKAEKVSKSDSRKTIKVEKKESNGDTAKTYKDERQASNVKLASLVKSDDPLRDKFREILAEALSKVSSEADEEILDQVKACDPIRVAASVESVMFAKMGRPNGPKKLKYRSIMFNMKDPKNPDLRRKVLLGEVKPEKLITMTPEEMASEQRQLEYRAIKEKALFDSQRGAAPKATTDQFRCGRCGQRKTTYYQMQTRSADEPMTTYVTCVNCNNHWKFC